MSNTPSANQLQPQEVFIKVSVEEKPEVTGYYLAMNDGNVFPFTEKFVTEVGWFGEVTHWFKKVNGFVLSESELRREKEAMCDELAGRIKDRFDYSKLHKDEINSILSTLKKEKK